jgi:Spy/CpxP family protein refolding chaperone
MQTTTKGGIRWLLAAVAAGSLAAGATVSGAMAATNSAAGPDSGDTAAAAAAPQDHDGDFDRGPGGFDRGGPGGFEPGGWHGGHHGWQRAWYRRGWYHGGPALIIRPGFGPPPFARGRAGRGRMAGPGGGQMLERPLLGAFRRLDLTADQRQKVRMILIDARQQAASRPAGAGAPPDFTALINPGDPDHAHAVQAAKDRAAQRIDRAEQTEQNLYNVLTAQQKTRLTQMFAQMRARMQQREAARNAGPGAAAGPGATPPRDRADR